MDRVPRKVAKELILQIKSLKITGHYFDPSAKSAYEFGRQMVSRKLKKINPSFDCSFVETSEKFPPYLRAEFADGSVWEINPSSYNSNQLRNILFSKASDVEDKLDVHEPEVDDDYEEEVTSNKKK